MERILRQGRKYDVHTLLTLQLVSKAWKEATLRAFSGHFTVKIWHGNAVKLARICRDLPSTSSLEIRSPSEAFDLSPISSCSGLSSLVLEHNIGGLWTGRQEKYLVLDVALLPSGLRDLRTAYWTYDISRLQQFESVGITSLYPSQTENNLADIYKLLQRLQGLKVEPLLSNATWIYL